MSKSPHRILSLLAILIFMQVGMAFGQYGPGGVGDSTVNGLWLRASDVAGTNGSQVQTWPDYSRNGNDAFQTTANQRPLYYDSSAINGQPIVRFDGSNDQMQVSDADILDGSSGLTYYTVLRVNNLSGAPRGILGKRISSGTSSNYAYTWFFWTGNRIWNDINSQNNRYNSGSTTYSNSTNYILGFNFDGSRTNSYRSRLYEESEIVVIANEASNSIINSNRDLAIGALNLNYGTYLGADYAEIIHFNYSIDSVERIIVDNYLSAKYNIGLTSNDLYVQDNPANGNYDFDVCGIGRISASVLQDDAQGASILRIMNPSDLDNNEFLLWGHNGGVEEATNGSDVPTGVDRRFDRVWRVNEVNGSGSAIDVGSLEIRWDLRKFQNVTAGDLRLLVDTDNDGLFSDESPLSGATLVGDSVYAFTGITAISNNVRFTLATANFANTPLPVELIDFKAQLWNDETVKLTWSTLSEINNESFTIVRSKDLARWDDVGEVSGNGNSRKRLEYSFIDQSPLSSTSYYRLRQCDYDGSCNLSSIAVVEVEGSLSGQLKIYPNPSDGRVNILTDAEIEWIRVYTIEGQFIKEFTGNKTTLSLEDGNSGTYLLQIKMIGFEIKTEKIEIK